MWRGTAQQTSSGTGLSQLLFLLVRHDAAWTTQDQEPGCGLTDDVEVKD